MPGLLEGIILNLTGGSGGTIGKSGNHAIFPGSALARTHTQALDPANPPNWANSNIKTCAPITGFENRTWEAVEATNKGFQERQTQSANFHKLLGLMQQWEALDAKDQKALRKYQAASAKSELGKRTANSKLAQALHALRPKYADLFEGIDYSDTQAQRRITELQNKYSALLY